MSLDARFLRQLIDDTKRKEKNNPRELMLAAVALLYPVNPEAGDATPPLPRASASYQQALHLEEKALDALSLELLQTAWEYLEIAARNEEFPLHQGAALREQGLLILRLLNKKPVPFTPTRSLIGAMTTLIGAEHFTPIFAEQLIQKAVEKGDICAQLYSIRRLLQIVNEKCPANQLECFKSWLSSHPFYKMDLTRFSKNLRASLGDEREYLHYNAGII